MTVTRDPGPATDAAEQARTYATVVGTVEGADDKAGVLDGIGRALSFPRWYGRNLDALEELLRDLSWLPEGRVVLVWDDAGLRRTDPGTHATVTDILTGAVATHADGSHPLDVVLVGRPKE